MDQKPVMTLFLLLSNSTSRNFSQEWYNNFVAEDTGVFNVVLFRVT